MKTYRGMRSGKSGRVLSVDGQLLVVRTHLLDEQPHEFAWGVLGRNTAHEHLAITILADCLGEEVAMAAYPAFVRQVVREMPGGDWELSEQQVRSWHYQWKLHAASAQEKAAQEPRDAQSPAASSSGSPRVDVSAIGEEEQEIEKQMRKELRRLEEEWNRQLPRRMVSYELRGGEFYSPTSESAKTLPHLFGVAGMGLLGIPCLLLGLAILFFRPGDAVNGYLGNFMLGVAVVFIMVGTGMPIYHWLKWRNYRAAYDQFLRRRAEVIAERDRELAELERSKLGSSS